MPDLLVSLTLILGLCCSLTLSIPQPVSANQQLGRQRNSRQRSSQVKFGEVRDLTKNGFALGPSDKFKAPNCKNNSSPEL